MGQSGEVLPAIAPRRAQVLAPQPWGGILASAFTAVITVILTLMIKALIGPVFSDMNSALTYAYMGVAWSFMITLFFGIGFEKPYLWVGQKTPGTWEDVD